MKRSTLYTPLGIAGALLIPALAVAELEVPHVFAEGDLVSASEMNENFETLAAHIDQLLRLVADAAPISATVEELKARKIGAATAFAEIEGNATNSIFQVHADGFLTTVPIADGSSLVDTDIRAAPVADSTDASCGTEDPVCARMGRSFDGGTVNVLVPADHYVRVLTNPLGTARVRVYWQPLNAADTTKPTFLVDNG